MTRCMRAIVVAALAALALSLAAPGRGVRHSLKKVVDFYLLLPGEYFEGEPDTPKWRMSLAHAPGSLIDIGNGYLHVHGDGAQQDLTVCLFRRPAGSYLVAVAQNEKVVFDPFLDFFEYRGRRLRGVPRHLILPRRYDPELDYILPRQGRTIHARYKGRRKYDLTWTGTRFRVVH